MSITGLSVNTAPLLSDDCVAQRVWHLSSWTSGFESYRAERFLAADFASALQEAAYRVSLRQEAAWAEQGSGVWIGGGAGRLLCPEEAAAHLVPQALPHSAASADCQSWCYGYDVDACMVPTRTHGVLSHECLGWGNASFRDVPCDTFYVRSLADLNWLMPVVVRTEIGIDKSERMLGTDAVWVHLASLAQTVQVACGEKPAFHLHIPHAHMACWSGGGSVTAHYCAPLEGLRDDVLAASGELALSDSALDASLTILDALCLAKFSSQWRASSIACD